MRVADVQREMGIGRSTAWRLVTSGQLAIVKVGRAILIERTEYERFIAANTTPAKRTGATSASFDADWYDVPELPEACTVQGCPARAEHDPHVWPPCGPGSRAWCPGVNE